MINDEALAPPGVRLRTLHFRYLTKPIECNEFMEPLGLVLAHAERNSAKRQY